MKLFSAILAGIAAALAASGAPELRNGVAAVVNDSVITFQEVEDYTGEAIDLLRRTYGRTQPELFQQKRIETMTDGLEQLIEKQLILDDFKASGGQLPESFVDEEVKDRIRKQFGDRVTLTKTLQARGVRLESFRKRVHDDIIVNFMRQKNVSSAITISPTKIEHFYATNQPQFKVEDQVKLRRIVLNRSGGNSADELLNLAREIIRKLNEGASFAEMAGVYSQVRQKEGAEWFERKVLRKGLSDIVFTLQTGQRTGIVGMANDEGAYWVYEYDQSGQVALGRKYSEKDDFIEAKRFDVTAGAPPPTPQEIYLFYVEEKQDQRIKPLTEVHDDIEKTLIAQERTRLHKRWIDRLKTKSFVTHF
jgi:parvulin-like peptidyl-prolyl isomerase